ncbi:MAG: hypothetical protein ACP5KN_12375 [Armatimonadota bacterium]
MAAIPAVLTRPALIAHEDRLYLPCLPEHHDGGPTLQVASGPEGLLHFGYQRWVPRDPGTLLRRHGLLPPVRFERTDDEALPIVLELAADVIRQWRRSRDEGIEYDPLAPAPSANTETGAPSEALVTDPRLIWFGWVYELDPDEGGPVHMGDSRYAPRNPVRVHAWWAAANARLGRMQEQASEPTPNVDPHPEMVQALHQRITDNEGRDATLFLDPPLHLRWCAAKRQVQFIMSFEAFALGDRRGTYYAFPAGSVIVGGELAHMAAFAEFPAHIRIGASVEMDGPLHPCVSNERRLCTAGGIEEVCSQGLSPAGTIIRVLELSVQVLLTGLGAPDGPTLHRNLEQTGAATITRAEADRLGIPVIPWRHDHRGRQEIRL